ncbi:MAG: hypothetical protein H0T42_20090 [Deltaproteobacteria bacterium]|nr:hypothetical protein [Deltaproteobacteria bacterium]
MKRTLGLVLGCCTLLSVVPSCATDENDGEIEDGEQDHADGKADAIGSGSVQAAAILAMVNDPAIDEAALDVDARLSTRVARNIITNRPYGSLRDLDDVPYVGPATLAALLRFSIAEGYLKPAMWRRIGSVPAGFRDRYSYGLGHQVVSSGMRVLVGTPDGVWSAARSTGVFKRVGLPGITVMFIHVDPADPNRIYAGGTVTTGDPMLATFYISSDGGLTFRPASSPSSADAGGHLGFADFTFVPGKPDHMIANSSGMMLMVSTDRGATWALSRRDTTIDTFSYPCHVLALDPGRIVQRCEVPLDDAWVGTRSIDPNDPLDLREPRKVLANGVPGLPDLGNRRPNMIELAATRTSFFVGVEGGLYEYDLASSTGRWWYDEPPDAATGTYVGSVWLDPANAQHAVFGGFDKRNGSLSVLETHDRGAHVARLMPPTTAIRHLPVVHDIRRNANGRFDVVVSDMPSEDPLDAATYSVYELTVPQ